MSSEFEVWRRALSQAPALSSRFTTRHARVLSQWAKQAAVGQQAQALVAATSDPRAAARLLHGLTTRIEDHSRHRDVHGYDGPPAAIERVQSWLDGRCVDCVITEAPTLQRTWVPLHPARRATRLADAPGGPLIAVAWPRSSVTTRRHHQAAVKRLVDQVNAERGPDNVRLSVPSGEVMIYMSVGDPWVIAEDHGPTLEDQLRDDVLEPNTRRPVVDALTSIRRAMLDHQLVWQGFAPRNMFWQNGELRLIDFEECVASQEHLARAAECLEWHQIFFADCLTPVEAAIVFAPHPLAPTLPDNEVLSADEFERALLGVETVDWSTRRDLLGQSRRIEGRHQRPSVDRDRGVLFGHELGHFWGDFVPPATEARLFGFLAPLDPSSLVACLEIFEAAMEADIDGQLRAAALGQPLLASARTITLVDSLETFGVDVAIEFRRHTVGWYDELETHPAGLVDRLLFSIHHQAADDLPAYLVGDPSQRQQHRQHLVQSIDAGLAFVHGDGRGDRFLNHRQPDELRELLADPLPVAGADLDDVLKEVDERITRYSIAQAHPGYLAFPDAGNAIAALAGSLLTKLLNQNLIAVDRSAPAATFATIQVIEWLRALVGYDAKPITELRGVRDVAGLWTTGGHLSNHIAMLTALGQRFPDARQQGLRALDTQPAVVMAGPIAHYSHGDAAFHLGLGWDAVLQVSARADYTTDPTAIDELLAHPPSGVTPFMVIGVAGNCRTTGLDDLAAIAEVCQRRRVWFHADACHGGSLLFSHRLRQQCLAGIELADSVSLDPHKGLFTPYPSSYVVFRERGVLKQFSRHTATVEDDDVWDLGLITPFVGSCGFEALPTWMLIKHAGVERLGAIVESRQALVRHIERRLDDSGLFVRLNDVDFYRLAFVFCPPTLRAMIKAAPADQRSDLQRVVSAFTSRLNTTLYQDGAVCFDEHTLADLDDRVGCGPGAKYTIMACCPGNPLTTMTQLDRAIDRLIEVAGTLTPQLLDHVLLARPEPAPSPRYGPAGWSDQ